MIDYEGSDYQTSFWEEGGREYEDRCEQIALKRLLPDGGDLLLEIGAGAGRFTQVLADLGAHICVADISATQLELNRELADKFEFAHAVEDWVQADICDLSQFAAGSFDCVVAYGGPLSYVLDQRVTAVQACARVLRGNGRFLASVMSLWGSAHNALQGVLAIPAASNRRLTTTGDITADTIPGREGHFMHMFRAGEFRDLLEQAGFSALALSASNCLSIGWNDYLAEIRHDTEKWGELLRMELEVCADPASLNSRTHIIGVAVKG